MKSEKIQQYIDYFSKNDFEFFTMYGRFYKYHEVVNEFIDAFYKSELSDPNYLNTMSNYQEPHLQLIKIADKHLIKSIFTYYVRGERFCEGMWADAIRDKIFLNILIRLNQIEEESYN
ncbi:DUF6508 domain-containing protein [Gottfriedia sp. NPDC056225]|uniref:DUF6508 domain-containing protein n=1 Tax=Gottfriedia sp. NPDC056225 TaxID=3345751 RepID=UPI0035D9B31E